MADGVWLVHQVHLSWSYGQLYMTSDAGETKRRYNPVLGQFFPAFLLPNRNFRGPFGKFGYTTSSPQTERSCGWISHRVSLRAVL